VHLVAIDATDAIPGVRPSEPVPCMFALRVTIEASRVCVDSLPLGEANDLRGITRLEVQTAGTVAILTSDPLPGVEGMAIILCFIAVTRVAHLRPNLLGTLIPDKGARIGDAGVCSRFSIQMRGNDQGCKTKTREKMQKTALGRSFPLFSVSTRTIRPLALKSGPVQATPENC